VNSLMSLPHKIRNELPPGLEPGVVDSKSTVLTNYTIGAGASATISVI
jgi:hypothetical protein